MKANLMRPISLSLPFVLLILSSTRITAGEAPATSGVAPPGIQLGTTAEVKLSGKPGDGSLKVWSSRPGITWDVSEKGDTAKVTAGADAVPGLYWIRFYNQFGATELRPFFVGVIPEIAEAEPNNTLAEAQAIDKPSVLINGVLHKTGEVDIWSVDVPAGKTIVASMQANSKLGSPMDGVLQILDPKGTVVAQNDDDHGFDPLVTWTPKTTGRMIKYNKINGFLVRNSSDDGEIWIVTELTPNIKDCSQHAPKNILIIDEQTNQQHAKEYLSNLVKGTVTVVSSGFLGCKQ